MIVYIFVSDMTFLLSSKSTRFYTFTALIHQEGMAQELCPELCLSLAALRRQLLKTGAA